MSSSLQFSMLQSSTLHNNSLFHSCTVNHSTMSNPSSWQKWASDQQRKDLFVVSTPHSTTNVPTPNPTSSARSTGKSQLETKTTVAMPPQHLPHPIPSIAKTSNQQKTETSINHHPPTIAALPRSTSVSPTPAKLRPATTDVVARRLIGRALGINIAKREGEGEGDGERFGINTKTKRKQQPQPQTKLNPVKKMEEVDIN
jgi:hypothetical protein